MPRDATTTREGLIRAAERLFARKGVDGTLTRELVEEAGQANDSVVNYHFGSRGGLLLAVLDRHVRRMEEQRKPALDRLGLDAKLPDVLDAVVAPLADQLRTEDGRDFLRIAAQLAGHAGVRTDELPAPVAGTALAGQLALLTACCRDLLPEPEALERVALMITMLTAALADQARRIDEGERATLGHDAFVATLTAMLTAALSAPGGLAIENVAQRDEHGRLSRSGVRVTSR
jgi:AcrR family transcriptional regulator